MSLPSYLEAKVGEYKPLGSGIIRITAGGCVMDNDMRSLLNARLIERNVHVAWGDEIKRKKFTRLMVDGKPYLACRTTGTLYNERTGASSTHALRLA